MLCHQVYLAAMMAAASAVDTRGEYTTCLIPRLIIDISAK